MNSIPYFATNCSPHRTVAGLNVPLPTLLDPQVDALERVLTFDICPHLENQTLEKN